MPLKPRQLCPECLEELGSYEGMIILREHLTIALLDWYPPTLRKNRLCDNCIIVVHRMFYNLARPNFICSIPSLPSIRIIHATHSGKRIKPPRKILTH